MPLLIGVYLLLKIRKQEAQSRVLADSVIAPAINDRFPPPDPVWESREPEEADGE